MLTFETPVTQPFDNFGNEDVAPRVVPAKDIKPDRLGAFQKNTIGATIRSLNVASENTAAAQSVIRDANFATETAQLTRAQILTSSATQILSLANQQPQSVLQLLG